LNWKKNHFEDIFRGLTRLQSSGFFLHLSKVPSYEQKPSKLPQKPQSGRNHGGWLQRNHIFTKDVSLDGFHACYTEAASLEKGDIVYVRLPMLKMEGVASTV